MQAIGACLDMYMFDGGEQCYDEADHTIKWENKGCDYHQRAFLGVFIMMFATIIALYECSRIW